MLKFVKKIVKKFLRLPFFSTFTLNKIDQRDIRIIFIKYKSVNLGLQNLYFVPAI
jgi:hypothetical protein